MPYFPSFFSVTKLWRAWPNWEPLYTVLKWVWNLKLQSQECIVLPIFHFYYQAADIHDSLLTLVFFRAEAHLMSESWKIKQMACLSLPPPEFYLHQTSASIGSSSFILPPSSLNSTFLWSDRKCSKEFYLDGVLSFFFFLIHHSLLDCLYLLVLNKALGLDHLSHCFLNKEEPWIEIMCAGGRQCIQYDHILCFTPRH